jgi:hypothetical protein
MVVLGIPIEKSGGAELPRAIQRISGLRRKGLALSISEKKE